MFYIFCDVSSDFEAFLHNLLWIKANCTERTSKSLNTSQRAVTMDWHFNDSPLRSKNEQNLILANFKMPIRTSSSFEFFAEWTLKSKIGQTDTITTTSFSTHKLPYKNPSRQVWFFAIAFIGEKKNWNKIATTGFFVHSKKKLFAFFANIIFIFQCFL